jgi:hypothetical protein
MGTRRIDVSLELLAEIIKGNVANVIAENVPPDLSVLGTLRRDDPGLDGPYPGRAVVVICDSDAWEGTTDKMGHYIRFEPIHRRIV